MHVSSWDQCKHHPTYLVCKNNTVNNKVSINMPTFSFSDSISKVRSHFSNLSEYDLTKVCSCPLQIPELAAVDLLCPNTVEDQVDNISEQNKSTLELANTILLYSLFPIQFIYSIRSVSLFLQIVFFFYFGNMAHLLYHII